MNKRCKQCGMLFKGHDQSGDYAEKYCQSCWNIGEIYKRGLKISKQNLIEK